MVGDSIDDMTAGANAGAATVLLVNETNEHLVEHEHTYICISRSVQSKVQAAVRRFVRDVSRLMGGRLDELIEILETGTLMQHH